MRFPSSSADVTITAPANSLIPVVPGTIIRKTGTAATGMVAFPAQELSLLQIPLTRSLLRIGASFGGGVIATTTWDPTINSTNYTFSNGNLTATRSVGAGSDENVKASAAKSSGYFEVKILASSSAIDLKVGLSLASQITGTWIGSSGSIGYAGNGIINTDGAGVDSGLPTLAANDVVGVYLSGGKVWFNKNGVWVGTGGNPSAAGPGYSVPATMTNGLPSMSTFTATEAGLLNCGQNAFTGSVPGGGSAWG